MRHHPSRSRASAGALADAERRLRRLDLLQRLTEAVNRAERVETIYGEAIEGLEHVLGADRASILLLDEDGVTRFKAWRNLSARYCAAVEGHSPWLPADPDPHTIVVPDVLVNEQSEPLRSVLTEEGIRALVIVPLVDVGELLGRMVVYYDKAHEPEAEDVRLAESIARHVALAITRRRAWNELSRREAEFMAIAERAPDIIARFDSELRHMYVNPAIERATGMPREHFIGRTHRELGTPEPLLGEWESALRRVFETASGDTMGFAFTGPQGIRYFESNMVPEIAPTGEVRSLLVLSRDITERKRAEQRLQFLTEASALVASSLDVEKTLSTLARLAAEELGDGCAIDMLGADGSIKRLAIHMRDARLTELFEEMERRFPSRMTGTAGNVVALRTGQPQLYREVTEELMRAASENDEQMELWRRIGLRSAMCVPIIARGRTLGVLTLVSSDESRLFDETDLDVAVELARRAAIAVDHALLFAETRRARDEAESANEAKASFLAVMSHELRTPLAAILGYAELVIDEIVGPLNPTQRDQLERIKVSGTHLLMLIEEILGFARIEAGHESLRLAEVDVGEIMREAAAVVDPLVLKRKLEFGVEVAEEPLTVVTDGGKVRQILFNLLGNAIKFTEQGHIRIAADRHDGGVRFTVEDTGIGIPPEHIDHVFDPFWQVEHVTTRRQGGTGLGLSVARQLARLLGGDIFVESQVGVGSRFSVVLPGEAPDENAPGQAE